MLLFRMKQKPFQKMINLHAKQAVWNICLETQQPAKSPDTNVLDLSFFRALQAKQWSLGSETTVDGLVAQVLQAFKISNQGLLIVAF